MALEGSKFEV